MRACFSYWCWPSVSEALFKIHKSSLGKGKAFVSLPLLQSQCTTGIRIRSGFNSCFAAQSGLSGLAPPTLLALRWFILRITDFRRSLFVLTTLSDMRQTSMRDKWTNHYHRLHWYLSACAMGNRSVYIHTLVGSCSRAVKQATRLSSNSLVCWLPESKNPSLLHPRA